MYDTESAPSIATAQLYSHLEQQAQSIAPQVTIVPTQIQIERVGLTKNASNTPYIVYYVGKRRCCTFFKRKLLWHLIQAMVKSEYGIEDKIRSITFTENLGLSLKIGESWRHILNRQACCFIERANNSSIFTPQPAQDSSGWKPWATGSKAQVQNWEVLHQYKMQVDVVKVANPVEVLLLAMREAITRQNWSIVKEKLATHAEYKAQAWELLKREEKQQLRAIVPLPVKLLTAAKRQGIIADYTEASEDDLYWVRVTPSSDRQLVTSQGTSSFLGCLSTPATSLIGSKTS